MSDLKAGKPSWITIVREAASLWLRFQAGRELDADGKLEDPIWAIDPSVAMLFVAPAETKDRPDLLGLLDEETLSDFAFLLGAQCRNEARNRSIFLYGQEADFQSIYSSMVRAASGARKGIQSVFPELSETHPSNGEESFIKLRLVRKALSTADAKFTLLRNFIRETQIADSVSAERAGLMPKVNTEDDEVDKLAQVWFDALKAKKSKRRAAHLIQSDAVALAHLHFLNLTSDRPVLLLTSDPHIHEISSELELPGSGFVVDPRYLFFREEFSIFGGVVVSQDGIGLEDWLRIVLSPFSRGGKLDPKRVRDFLSFADTSEQSNRSANVLIRTTIERIHGGTVDSLPSRFRRFVRLKMNAAARDILDDIPTFANLGQKILDGQSSDTEELLRRWQIAELTNINTTALVTSLFTSKQATASDRTFKTRMPLAIRYRDESDRLLFSQQLQKAIETKRIAKIQDRDGTRQKYNMHLVSCQLHAAMGDWRAADSLARMAVLLAELGDESDPIYGHEAFYATAVTARHRLDRASEIGSIVRSLDEAKARFSRRYEGRSDLRFSVELVSLEITRRYLLRYFPDEGWNEAETGLSSVSLDGMLESLAREGEALQVSEAELETDRIVDLSLLKQVSVNGISTLVLRALLNGNRIGLISEHREFWVFRAGLVYVAEAIQDSPDRGHQLSSEYFTFTIFLADYCGADEAERVTQGLKDRLTGQGKKIADRSEFRFDPWKINDIFSHL